MNKLIKINNHYYVIDDSEIKESDNYLWLNNNQICKAEGMLMTINNHVKNKHIVRITHSTQKGIGEQLNLNDIEELVNGYSVENLAESSNGYALYGKPLGEKYLAFKEGFLSGFEKQKELSKDKLFTDEQLFDLLDFAANNKGLFKGEILKKFKQSLLPKTEWNIEFQNGKIILV